MTTRQPVEFTRKVPGQTNQRVGNRVVLADENDAVIDGTNPLPVTDSPSTITLQRAAIDANTNGNNTIVAAVAGQQIKVLSLTIIASGDVNVRLESNPGGVALTGVMSLAVDGNGFVWPPSSPGKHYVETVAGQLLNLELSAGVQVGGHIIYYTE